MENESSQAILGIQINNLSMKQALERVNSFVENMRPKLVVTPNPEIICSAQRNEDILSVINNADLALADGVGVTLAGKILGCPFVERVPGIDLMDNTIKLAAEQNYGIYLLGASPAVVQVAAQKLNAQYPKLRVLGTMHGYFSTKEEEQAVLEDILDAQPDILYVGMGSPRQEQWACQNLQKLGVPVIICVGGSFDVISGYLKRAPKWMQRLGVEWLYRLFQEPKRWRRMLVLPWFLGLVCWKKIRGS